MDGARLSQFPRQSWLYYRVAASPTSRPLVVQMRSVAHRVSLTLRGQSIVRTIGRKSEARWDEQVGTVAFLPADGEHRTFIITMSPDFESAVFLIPRRHLRDCLTTTGPDASLEFRRLLTHDDHILRTCLFRLAVTAGSREDTAATAADEAARRLVLRLAECAGVGRSDWYANASTFDCRTLSNLVEHIDARLRIPPGLADLALLTGLSPSHFARKFRLSTGLSLHRFVNRRRLLQSLERLKPPHACLAELSLDLGFSSQSHFTRLFSKLTGMTPARYAKQFQRTSGS